MPYPKNPMDPEDPDYDPKLDPHNAQYTPNDPRLVGGRAKIGADEGLLSKDEADQYLASRRAKNTPAQSDIMSSDEADAYLAQRRAQQAAPAQTADTQGVTPSNAPAATASSQEAYPLGTGISTLFSKLPPSLQGVIREHPYLSGAAAAAAVPLAIGAGAMIPEAAIGGLVGAGIRNVGIPLARWGLGYAGLDWLTEGKLTPALVHLLTKGLDESPGGGVTP